MTETNRHCPTSGLTLMSGADLHTDRLCANASAVLDEIAATHDRLDVLDDEPGKRIHALFAGLYWYTTESWLSYVIRQTNPEFACLVIARFFELYATCGFHKTPDSHQHLPRYWHRYYNLACRRTFKDPIFAHLILISLAARAHTRHDLAAAIVLANKDYRSMTGRAPYLETYRSTIVGHRTDALFYDAAMHYIAFHRGRQSGWRKYVLDFYRVSLRLTWFVWLPIFQSWRNAAWKDACSEIELQDAF